MFYTLILENKTDQQITVSMSCLLFRVAGKPCISGHSWHLGYADAWTDFAVAMSLGSFSGLERLIVMSSVPYSEAYVHFKSFAILPDAHNSGSG